MNEIYSKLRNRIELPLADKMERAVSHFSFAEKVLFGILIVLFSGSSYLLFYEVNSSFTSQVPVPGGSLSEGIIGSPRFINPLLSTSEADRDLVSLVYSGLTRATPEGSLIPDLAASWAISEDGLSYDFLIKNDAVFQDGTLVTSEDIIFTVEKAKDPSLKSPKRASFDGVEVQKISDKEVRFVLRQPYAPFLENTTLGILPKHLWGNVSEEEFPFSAYNFEPVGSGPFKVVSVSRNSGGIPESYKMAPFEKYTLGVPYISKITLSFYSNTESLEAAYVNGVIESVNGITPERVAAYEKTGASVISTPLPRIFGVFFNQNQAPIFLDKSVRAALETSISREEIISKVLQGFGEPVRTAVPSYILRNLNRGAATTPEEKIAASREALLKAGWKWSEEKKVLVLPQKNRQGKVTGETELAFSISTGNVPELKKTADIVKETWEKVGARVDIKVFETGDLTPNVIRPRKYDALLFGMVVGRDLDLFAFWHSSQRNDPGLNVAMYANTKADKLLSEARTIPNQRDRIERYRSFEKEIDADTPAVFLYAPEFIYVLPEKIKGVDIRNITIPSERFQNVQAWYIDTERVWNIFVD